MTVDADLQRLRATALDVSTKAKTLLDELMDYEPPARPEEQPASSGITLIDPDQQNPGPVLAEIRGRLDPVWAEAASKVTVYKDWIATLWDNYGTARMVIENYASGQSRDLAEHLLVIRLYNAKTPDDIARLDFTALGSWGASVNKALATI